MEPDEPTYNNTWAVWLDGALEVSALQQAWDAVVARHEALRTTFRNEAGVPVQVIEEEPTAVPIPVTSVEHLAAGERELAAMDQIGKIARIPFDLATGPLARAVLVRLSPEAHVLAVMMHHIVADGWTFRIVFDELSADYEAISRAAARLPGNRRSSMPTSPFGRSSTPRTAGTRRMAGSGGPSWPMPRHRCRCRWMSRTRRARRSPAGTSTPRSTPAWQARSGSSRPGTAPRCSPSCWLRTRSCSPG
jgi:hypothetical protein